MGYSMPPSCQVTGVHGREGLLMHREKDGVTTAPREGMDESVKTGERAGPFRSSWIQDQQQVPPHADCHSRKS